MAPLIHFFLHSKIFSTSFPKNTKEKTQDSTNEIVANARILSHDLP